MLQSKILRAIEDVPWFVTNFTFHTDIKIPFIKDAITN
jgi:hypothetical protein